jgi:hypothetical protein
MGRRMKFDKYELFEILREQAPNLFFIACMLALGIMTSAIKPF